MKSGALWARCWELAQDDFGCDPLSSDSLRGRWNFVFFGRVNNARFHRFAVGNITQNLNTTTSIGEPVKTFATEYWKFYCKGSFFKKRKNCSQNFQVLRLQNVGRLTQLITRYLHHILSFFNIDSCNWNALGPAFIQSSDSVAEE